MSFEIFAANVDDLWFPAMDDIVCVSPSGNQLVVLVLDHEELITFSTVNQPLRCSGRLGSTFYHFPCLIPDITGARVTETDSKSGK